MDKRTKRSEQTWTEFGYEEDDILDKRFSNEKKGAFVRKVNRELEKRKLGSRVRRENGKFIVRQLSDEILEVKLVFIFIGIKSKLRLF